MLIGGPFGFALALSYFLADAASDGRAPNWSVQSAARCRARPGEPTCATSPPCSRSSQRWSASPATASGAHAAVPAPGGPRDRTSAEYFVCVSNAPSSQLMEPPGKPGRFMDRREVGRRVARRCCGLRIQPRVQLLLVALRRQRPGEAGLPRSPQALLHRRTRRADRRGDLPVTQSCLGLFSRSTSRILRTDNLACATVDLPGKHPESITAKGGAAQRQYVQEQERKRQEQ